MEKEEAPRQTDNAEQQQHHAHRASTSIMHLPPTRHVLVLHLAAWRDTQRWARNRAGRRVDDRDGVASALRHGLVQLHVVGMLAVAGGRRVERIGCGGEEE